MMINFNICDLVRKHKATYRTFNDAKFLDWFRALPETRQQDMAHTMTMPQMVNAMRRAKSIQRLAASED